jgi:hypothetical protein
VRFLNKLKYLLIRKELFENQKKIKKNLIKEWENKLNYKIENIRDKYSKDGWKKFSGKVIAVNPNNKYLKMPKSKFGNILVFTNLLIDKNSGNFYTGEVNLLGEMCGEGVLYTNDGSKYQGNFVNNYFSGWGCNIDSQGTFTLGVFTNGIINGFGQKSTYLNNKHYFGEFRNGLKHGKGKEVTEDHIYDGDFYDDQKKGKGKLTYKKMKDFYEGDFLDNSITGRGFYKWANKDTYEGDFINGKMHGKGIYKWPYGCEYEGEYSNNIRDGYGIFRWPNGQIYKGPFVNGNMHGRGILSVENNNFDIEFENGVKKANISYTGSLVKNTPTSTSNNII